MNPLNTTAGPIDTPVLAAVVGSSAAAGSATSLRNPLTTALNRTEVRRHAPGDERHNIGTSSAWEDAAALTLDGRGMIRDCNSAAEALFHCRRSELVWRHVSLLLPKLAEFDLMPNGQPNPHLRFLSRIGRRFQAVTHDHHSFPSDLFLTVLDEAANGRLLLIVRPVAEIDEQSTPGA